MPEVVTSQMHDHGSISFGRFSVESLSWERRSVFVHSRHEEELEKFNGLVAKKKAYFEERYRRIRASKASKRENQQTELILDYGGDGSISSQTEEENETANIVDARSEEVEVGVTFEQEISCEEVVESVSSVIEPNFGVSPQEISLSEETMGRIELDTSSNGDLYVTPIEIVSLPLNGNVEEIEEVCKGSSDSEELKIENLEPKVEKKLINKAHVEGIKGSESNKLRSIKKPLYSKSAPNVKDSASARNGRMLDQAPKKNATQAPMGIKSRSRTISGKAENSQIVGSGRAVQQVNNNGLRSALAPSNRSLAEPRSRITNPGPFTLVMERRASRRVSETKLDTMNLTKLPSSSIHANNGSNMQDVLKKKATISGVTSRRVESKRLIGEVKTSTGKPLSVDSKHTSMRRNEAPMQGTIKPRLSNSINLPARNSNVRAEPQLSTLRLQKLEEGKVSSQMKQPQGVAAKSLGSSMNGSTKILAKKPTPAKCNEQFHGGNKQRLDNLSLDGRKTRRDTQHWR